ncbi:MAG: hypothetical protein ACTSP5_10785 [Candidatus Heimdallarchaeota archaeon]
MIILEIIIIAFLVMEFFNVLALYFMKDSRKFNSIGVFNAWEKSKSDPEMHDFVKYLTNWVAGTKLIFIALLIVILITTEQDTIILTGIAMICSIATFFWKLFPLIRKMDKASQITPKNYSRLLFIMILSFIIIFVIGIVLAFI